MNTNTTSKITSNTMNEQNERSSTMRVIELTKQGYGTVTFVQNGDICTITINKAPLNVTKEEGNRYYNFLKNEQGWTRKQPKDVKAPKPENSEKKQSTPRLQWNKEGKKAWAVEFNRRKTEALKGIMSLKGKEYHEARINLEKQLKAEMKVWEAENADRINEEIDHRRAEAVAIGG